MKNIILLFFIPFLGLAQPNKLDEKNGFETYVFGSTPAQYKNLTLEIEDGNTKLYSLNQSNIALQGAEFEYLRITFYNNKLSAITLQTKNATGQKFLQSLKESYGEPVKLTKPKENYEWVSNKYRLLYEANAAHNDATVSFYAKTASKSKK
ncbi:MAG: hypothetical protein ABIP51_15325 [Bacteroidia bacterium]